MGHCDTKTGTGVGGTHPIDLLRRKFWTVLLTRILTLHYDFYTTTDILLISKVSKTVSAGLPGNGGSSVGKIRLSLCLSVRASV